MLSVLAATLAALALAGEPASSPLWEAAKSGDLARVRQLVDAGRQAGETGGAYAQPALAAAANEGHAAVVEFLLRKGAAPNARDKLGYPVLVYAVWSRAPGAPAVIGALLRAGADPALAGSDSKSPPQIVAETGSVPQLQAMLDNGVAVDFRTPHQETLLAISAANGRSDAVKLLLERGAAVNAVDDEGFTPLMNACQNRHVEVVKLLLVKGADRNVKNRYGETAQSFVQGKHEDTQAAHVRRQIADLLK
jgi:ankyrin repeat protein